MINTQLNTEPRFEIKFLKSKHRIRQLPGCYHGAMIERVVVILGDGSIVPSDKKIMVAAMTNSIKDLKGKLYYCSLPKEWQ